MTEIIEINGELIYCCEKITGNDFFRYYLLDENKKQKSEFPFGSLDKINENYDYIAYTSGKQFNFGKTFNHKEVAEWCLKVSREKEIWEANKQ